MSWIVLAGLVAPLLVPSAGESRKVTPVLLWTGAGSKQTEALFARAASQRDWQAIWHRHMARDRDTDDRTCPEVDFGSYLVVALFPGAERIRLSEVVEAAGCVRVRFQLGSQVAFLPGWKVIKVITDDPDDSDGKGNPTGRFLFLVLPRSNRVLVVEEDVSGRIGGPAVWKERARFPAEAPPLTRPGVP
jgi:hypothetical protein